MSLRITLADDHRIIRIGLRAILEDHSDIVVVGEAETAQGALEVVRAQQPDVAIIDLNLPDGFGLSVVPAMHDVSPRTRILVLTMHAEAEVVRQALAAGVHGYVNKGADPDEVVRAVRSLGAGRSYLDVPLERHGLASVTPGEQAVTSSEMGHVATQASRLSAREREVLLLFVEGCTQRQIADRLGLRIKTVETYRARLGDKFGVRSRADLVRCAKEMLQLS